LSDFWAFFLESFFTSRAFAILKSSCQIRLLMGVVFLLNLSENH
jgi:hypothetical protein